MDPAAHTMRAASTGNRGSQISPLPPRFLYRALQTINQWQAGLQSLERRSTHTGYYTVTDEGRAMITFTGNQHRKSDESWTCTCFMQYSITGVYRYTFPRSQRSFMSVNGQGQTGIRSLITPSRAISLERPPDPTRKRQPNHPRA